MSFFPLPVSERDARTPRQGLVFSAVVHGKEDQGDIEIGEEDESARRTEETVTPASDILVRDLTEFPLLIAGHLQEGKEDEDPNRIPSSPDFRTIYVFAQPARATGKSRVTPFEAMIPCAMLPL